MYPGIGRWILEQGLSEYMAHGANQQLSLCKHTFIGTKIYPFIHVLSTAATMATELNSCDRPPGPQRLEYLLFDPSWKEFSDSCSSVFLKRRENRQEGLGVSLQNSRKA